MPIQRRIRLLKPGLASTLAILTAISVAYAGAACSPPSSTPPNVTATGDTFGQLAQEGQDLYNTNCGECHGLNGQGNDGPALWGQSARLSKFDTAQGVLNYVSATMPKGAAGSLSHQAYANILAYILVKAGDVTSDMAFAERQLTDIQVT